jgi:hypothetical protein
MKSYAKHCVMVSYLSQFDMFFRGCCSYVLCSWYFFSLRAHIKNEENIQDGCVPCLLVLVTDA